MLACRNASSVRVSANHRLRTPAGVTYFRDIGLRGLPLPFSEHGSCVRSSVAAGIAGLAASTSSVSATVSSAVLIFAPATPARRQPAHSAARHAA
jgi:hypothetical protein